MGFSASSRRGRSDATADSAHVLALNANAFANPRRNNRMHVVLRVVLPSRSREPRERWVRGGGESVDVPTISLEGPTEPQSRPEEPTMSETGAPDMRCGNEQMSDLSALDGIAC